MKPELGAVPSPAGEDVDLLGGLRLAAQPLERLDGARLDLAEAVQREHLAQRVEHVGLDEALGRGPLGESGKGRKSRHGAHCSIG